MTDAELLTHVKNALGITGEYQNPTLTVYINEVKEFLRDSGVADGVINSNLAIGVISRGVSDLWNYGSGNTAFSAYFMQRVIQLSYKDAPQEEEEETNAGLTMVDGKTFYTSNGELFMPA